MKQHQEMYFPDHEEHLLEWMTHHGEIIDGRGTYQIKKLRAALEYCKQFRVAVDIGAHVGLWALQLAKKFQQVHAFEPVQEHRECFEKNLSGLDNVLLYPYALGAREGGVALECPKGSSGNMHVVGNGDIPLKPLDSFDLQNVDFVKIDCEGYEMQVLEGAEQMLLACRPCVIVEQKQHVMSANFGTSGTPAVDFLLSLGAKHRKVISGDHILSWD